MRGGDGQFTLFLAGEFFAYPLEVPGFTQDGAGDVQYLSARLADGHHALAVADEHLHAQFVLEQPDLLGNARLRGVQFFGGFGHVQSLAGHFDQIAQLLQFHRISTGIGISYITEGDLTLTQSYFVVLRIAG